MHRILCEVSCGHLWFLEVAVPTSPAIHVTMCRFVNELHFVRPHGWMAEPFRATNGNDKQAGSQKC